MDNQILEAIEKYPVRYLQPREEFRYASPYWLFSKMRERELLKGKTPKLTKELFVKANHLEGCDPTMCILSHSYVIYPDVPYVLGIKNAWVENMEDFYRANPWHEILEEDYKHPIEFEERDSHPNKIVDDLAHKYISKYLKWGGINGISIGDNNHWDSKKYRLFVKNEDGTYKELTPERDGSRFQCYKCRLGLHELSHEESMLANTIHELEEINKTLLHLEQVKDKRDKLTILKFSQEDKVRNVKRKIKSLHGDVLDY